MIDKNVFLMFNTKTVYEIQKKKKYHARFPTE